MNYVTINIRIPEEDYLRLKAEAAKKRKSLAYVVREKLTIIKQKVRSKSEVEKLMRDMRKLAASNAKYLKGWDSLKVLREIRDEN